MVMFVLHEDGSNFFNFNIEARQFKIGETIENKHLEGKHEVVSFDPATVTVKPISKESV